jgi:hypothetical protein
MRACYELNCALPDDVGDDIGFISNYVFRFFRMRAIVKPSVSFPEGRTLEGRYLAGRDMQERNRQDQIGLEEVG